MSEQQARQSPALLSAIILLLLVVGAGGAAYYLSHRPEPDSQQEAIKERRLGRIPDTWGFTSLDGKEMQMKDLAGKVVFINLWGTFCPPCIGEMPSIQELQETLKGSEVAFVILSPEPMAKVKPFVKEHGWSLPFYVATEGVPPVLSRGVVPVTIVVNRKGEVVFRLEGAPRDGWNTKAFRAFLSKIS